MADKPKVVTLTQREIREQIEVIYRAHPSLKGLDPSEACCSGCFQHEVAGAYGWDAADAWEQLQSLYFLLGGK